MRFSRQVGRGTYFAGRRYQRGNGFFGRMIKNAIYPLLKYIGSKGIKTAMAIGKEAITDPSTDLKTIAKRKLKETGLEVMEDSVKKVREYVQSGRGLKRKRLGGIKRNTKRTKTSAKQSPSAKITKPKRTSKPKRRPKLKPIKKKAALRKRVTQVKKKLQHLFLKKNGSAPV